MPSHFLWLLVWSCHYLVWIYHFHSASTPTLGARQHNFRTGTSAAAMWAPCLQSLRKKSLNYISRWATQYTIWAVAGNRIASWHVCCCRSYKWVYQRLLVLRANSILQQRFLLQFTTVSSEIKLHYYFVLTTETPGIINVDTLNHDSTSHWIWLTTGVHQHTILTAYFLFSISSLHQLFHQPAQVHFGRSTVCM